MNNHNYTIVRQEGMTRLFCASYTGGTVLAKRLLDDGADPNERSLEKFISLRSFPTGYPIDMWNPISSAILVQAASCGIDSLPNDLSPDVIMTIKNGAKEIRSNNIPIHVREKGWGFDNLYFPSIHGDHDMVKLLAQYGADPNAISMDGLFPLYLAAQIGALEIVKTLTENGAYLDMATPKGNTALWNAVDEGHEDVVRYLLEHGANPQTSNWRGETPYSTALKKGYHSIARLLN